jgi:hypothetical protein
VGRDGATLPLLAQGDSLCGSAEVGGGRLPEFARQGNSVDAPGGCESGRRLPLRLHALCCAAWGSAQPLGGVVGRGYVEPSRSVDSLCVSSHSSHLWVRWLTHYAHTTSGERAPSGARAWVGAERKVQSSDTCRGGCACGIARVVPPGR